MKRIPDENPADEYVWRFKLAGAHDAGPDGDALTEMVRQQVSALLRCVVLTHEGDEVRVSGFRLLCDPEQEHALGSSLGGLETPDD